MIFTSLTKILNKSSSSSTLNKTFDIDQKSIAITFEKSNIQVYRVLNNPLGPQGGVGPYF